MGSSSALASAPSKSGGSSGRCKITSAYQCHQKNHRSSRYQQLDQDHPHHHLSSSTESLSSVSSRSSEISFCSSSSSPGPDLESGGISVKMDDINNDNSSPINTTATTLLDPPATVPATTTSPSQKSGNKYKNFRKRNSKGGGVGGGSKPFTSSSSRYSSCKWSRILIVALCQMASVLSQALNPEPDFGEPIPNVTVAVGRDASLPCVVENLGTHKVAWVHIDRRMILTIHKHIVTRIPRFTVSFDSHKTWLLHINNVQQEDRGYYMCQLNTEPMISQVGYLQVVVPPNILDEESSESHVAVREHQNITLSCKAEGFPTPKIIWKREDGQPFALDRRTKVNMSEGERLHLTKISRLEMGAYLCIASNGVPPSVSKRIIIDVEFSPMIWVPNQLIGAPKGTNVTLECNTEAFPRAISYWVYDNMMILTAVKYFTETVETNYRTHMRLTIRNLKDRDFGTYRCLSKNSLGETEGSIRLYEIPQPSLPPKATEVRLGKDNNPVGVVRLNPISKDDKRIKGGKLAGGEREGPGKNKHHPPDSGLDVVRDSGRNAHNRGDTFRVPDIENAPATDNAGATQRLFMKSKPFGTLTLCLTVLLFDAVSSRIGTLALSGWLTL